VTETAWHTSVNPQPMLAYIAARVGERELREFAAACCRRVWHLLPQPGDDFDRLLELCQQLTREAPPDADRARLYVAAAAACAAFTAAAAEHAGSEAEAFAAHAVYAASALTGSGYADEESEVWSVAADAAAADDATKGVAERAAQAELARRVFGNPFAR
jgi:hypothetical protein